jgi:acetate---CoA ligase (ADP-forming) subunit beta
MRILSIDQVREILEKYEIPTPKEGAARDAPHALEIAKEIGYPVVLKVISPDVARLGHVKGILLNVNSDSEVTQGFESITRNVSESLSGARIEGVLVQEMLFPEKEVTISMVRDNKSNPVIMFGLGGIFSEILKDLSYRTGQVTKNDARKMMEEIDSHNLLEGTDTDSLAKIITKVSKIGVEMQDVSEVEMNPVFLYEKGALAVNTKIISI